MSSLLLYNIESQIGIDEKTKKLDIYWLHVLEKKSTVHIIFKDLCIKNSVFAY